MKLPRECERSRNTVRAATCPARAGENALHFIDLLALRFDGLVAEPLDLGIADLRLSATFSMGMPLREG